MQQIWELTPRSHPDHLSMFSLFNSMDLVIKVIQEVKAREEELTYIKELASRISGLPHTFGLAHRERRLIAQGLLRRVFLSDREVLEGYGTPSERSREPSPRPSMPPSPKDPSTPPLPELGKLGPITSPLFPAYHNKTPILPYASSPFTPRRSYMSALSRTSTALSEASHSSEWMASNSATSSVAISSDFDTGERPDSSASSILSIIQSPFSPYSANASMNAQRRPANSSTKNAWSKGTKEIPVYAFVFTDMILFTTQAEKHGLFQHKQVPSESMSLVDVVGISRVLGVCDRSGKLGSVGSVGAVLILLMIFRLRLSDPGRCIARVVSRFNNLGRDHLSVSHPSNNQQLSFESQTSRTADRGQGKMDGST
jgi:hypothetical protein